jgi:hypoxanthine-DNA glycosylase
MAKSPELLAGLSPVLDRQVRVLILGSFPGAASLAAQQYYAHPRNQFWRLVGTVLGEDLAALPYRQRLPRLLAHRVGLWDVLAACERDGSLDTAIRAPRPNDFNLLAQRCPSLRRVCFNGKTAGRLAVYFEHAGYQTLVLPSSSPAHAAMSFEQKLASWRALAG